MQRVYIGLPDEAARRKLLSSLLGSNATSLDSGVLADVASVTEGMSGSDIAVMVNSALMEPVRIAQAATHFR